MPKKRPDAVISTLVLQTELRRTKTLYVVTRLVRPIGGRLVAAYAIAGQGRRSRLKPVTEHIARVVGLEYLDGQRALQLPEGRDAAWLARKVGEKTSLGGGVRAVQL